MSEAELAEYARKKGLYVEQIKAWKDACMNANGGIAKEATASGAKLSNACNELGITDRTYYRWNSQIKADGETQDQRPVAERPSPQNKITDIERQRIINTCNEPKYASMPPCEIVPALADEGIYIASESTFYRVLREAKMQNHRGRASEGN